MQFGLRMTIWHDNAFFIEDSTMLINILTVIVVIPNSVEDFIRYNTIINCYPMTQMQTRVIEGID